MSKLLITGALGHIGSQFIHSIKPGDFQEVRLLDNLLTQRYVTLFNLPEGVKFNFIEEDICTTDLVKHLKGIDTVIHLAAITNAAGSFEIQEEVEKVNFEGTKRLAEACLETGAKLIFLSTTSVYGTQNSIVDENCTLDELKPQSPYADSKLRAERLLEQMGKDSGLRFIICRFGTIFGTSVGMRFHTAINKFVWQACLGIPLTVWKTALDQNRPYLDLNDGVRALNYIIKNDLIDRQVYNVLTTNASVRSITEEIKNHISDLQIHFVDSKIMNQLSYNVSSEKFKARGFTASGSLSKGIAETVELIRNMHVR